MRLTKKELYRIAREQGFVRDTSIDVRLYESGDAYAIWRLNQAEMGYDYSQADTELRLKALSKSRKDRIFVAICNGDIAGYIHVNDYDLIYSPHMKNIMGVAVFNKYKRHGIGTALMNAAEEWAKADGACGIRLVSGETRTDAHKFYRACGYGEGRKQMNFKKYF